MGRLILFRFCNRPPAQRLYGDVFAEAEVYRAKLVQQGEGQIYREMDMRLRRPRFLTFLKQRG